VQLLESKTGQLLLKDGLLSRKTGPLEVSMPFLARKSRVLRDKKRLLGAVHGVLGRNSRPLTAAPVLPRRRQVRLIIMRGLFVCAGCFSAGKEGG
jgi:hypothetical protein